MIDTDDTELRAATGLSRETLEVPRRMRLRRDIATYAIRVAGTSHDLDADLEAASLALLE